MLTEKDLDELKKKHEAATPGAYLVEKRDDEDGSIDFIVYGSKGDFTACFETANHSARQNAEAIAALYNAFPDLERLARFGLKAKTFLDERGAVCGEALDQARHAWSQRLNPVESRAHGGALDDLRTLLAAARALDGGGE